MRRKTEEDAVELFPELDEACVANNVARITKPFYPSPAGPCRIVIFGTGALGSKVAKCARLAKLDVCAVADNSPARWGSDFEGLKILAPREAVARYGAALFVIAIYHPSSVVEQLKRLGCRDIATYPAFFWNFSGFFKGISGLARPEWLLSHETEIREAYTLLADPTSRREYRAQVSWRCTLDDSRLPQHLPASDMHFDSSIYQLSDDETLVDCGAFDGDSLNAFMMRTHGSFRQAYALEPDPENRSKLEAYVRSLPSPSRSSISILPFAAGAQNGTMRFNAGRGVSSTANDSGETELQCRRLDDIIPTPPSLIKMDIEGSEPEALNGAATLIRECRPILAICAYHYCEHLWELPVLINRLAPDFDIVLRRYAEQCWETVYYAVPSERRAF